MPKVEIPRLKRILETDATTTIFSLLRANDIPIASSCQSEGICGKCKIRIVSGSANLSPISIDEQRLAERLRWQLEGTKPERAACRTSVASGTVIIETDYW